MLHLKNLNSLIEITVLSILSLLSVLTILIVLSGGADAYERHVYRVIITRPGSNVTTQMRVYAENEEEARENVALNGWQIIAVNRADEQAPEVYRGGMNTASAAQTETAGTHLVSVTKIGKGDIAPIGKLTVNDGGDVRFRLKPGPCETLVKLAVNGNVVDVSDSYHLKNIRKDTYVVAVFRFNGTQCQDNNIKDENLKEIGIVYFRLGKFKTKISPTLTKVLGSLSKDKKYVIIGHTDDVRVIPNVEYKDNYQLSSRRAKFLRSNTNIPDIKVMGMGPAYPVAPNKKNGQPLNRRAVIYERR